MNDILSSSVASVTDWAYAAGWETEEDYVVDECEPNASPVLTEEFFDIEAQDNIKTCIFRVETDSERNPAVYTYGEREILFTSDSGEYSDGFQVLPESILSNTDDDESTSTDEVGFDGHINRNIRLAMAMIDMTKPYIHLERITKITIDGDAKLQVDF